MIATDTVPAPSAEPPQVIAAPGDTAPPAIAPIAAILIPMIVQSMETTEIGRFAIWKAVEAVERQEQQP